MPKIWINSKLRNTFCTPISHSDSSSLSDPVSHLSPSSSSSSFVQAVNPAEDLIPTTLMNGVLTNNITSVITILSSRVNLYSPLFRRGFSPLHLACVLFHEVFVRLFIGYGADVREKTLSGETCLHLVVCSQSRKTSPHVCATICEMLMMAGCDAMQVDEKGYSPLWYAVRYVEYE